MGDDVGSDGFSADSTSAGSPRNKLPEMFWQTLPRRRASAKLATVPDESLRPPAASVAAPAAKLAPSASEAAAPEALLRQPYEPTLPAAGLQAAAMRATLGEVLTPAAFDHMIALATRFTEGVQGVLDEFDVPWSISRLGARAEYRFVRPAPRTGEESAAAADDDLDAYLHLAMCNRGILMTPFHNMALMCPDTSVSDVDTHTTVFREVVAALRG